MGKSIEEVYRDRNLLALAFVRSLRDRTRHEPGIRTGWYPAPDDDPADSEEWAIVWGHIPPFYVEGTPSDRGVPPIETVEVGQVSWHVPRDLAESVDWLARTPLFDGHSRAEKNARLKRYLGIND